MEATFWNFNKRVNSTKQPVGQGTPISFRYKDASDLHNPILMLNNWVDSWNYARIGNFYFFVNRCETIANNLFHVYLNIDVLASYKGNILATKANVLYSSTNYNKDLIDSRFSPTGIYTNTLSEIQTYFTNEGTFMLTCASTGVRHLGMTVTYFLTHQQMLDIAAEFNNPDTWDKIKQWFNNPFDSIVSLAWLPIPISRIPNKREVDIIIGNTTITGNEPIKGYVVDTISDIAIPTTSFNIQLDWSVSDFRRLAPYSRMYIYLPGCGLEELPIELFYNAESIIIDFREDIFTGNIEYIVYNGSLPVSKFSGNYKVQLPIAQVQTRVGDVVNFGAGVAATGALALSAHPYAAVTSGSYALANLLQPQITKQNGSLNGSFINGSASTKISIWIMTHSVNDEPDNVWREIIGGICNKVLQLSSLSGYVKTDSASVSADAYLSELNQINSMLNGGVYIE